MANPMSENDSSVRAYRHKQLLTSFTTNNDTPTESTTARTNATQAEIDKYVQDNWSNAGKSSDSFSISREKILNVIENCGQLKEIEEMITGEKVDMQKVIEEYSKGKGPFDI